MMPIASKEIDANVVTITFESPEQASEFTSWLSNSGEQEYFEARDAVSGDGEYDTPRSHFVNNFHYEGDNKVVATNV